MAACRLPKTIALDNRWVIFLIRIDMGNVADFFLRCDPELYFIGLKYEVLPIGPGGFCHLELPEQQRASYRQ